MKLMMSLLLATGLVAAAPGAAQGPAPALAATAAAPATTCELHIWPAERFQAMTSGWGGALGGVVGAIADSAGHANGDKARRSHLASALDADGQVSALQQLDLVNLLQLRPSTVIVHDAALDRKTVNKIDTRRAASTSPCYAELIVADFLYQKSPVYGRSLRTLFMLRDFGAAPAKPATFKTWGGNGLKIFPSKPGEDVTAADAELVDVFKRNFLEAAQNFAAKRKRA